MVHFEEQNAGEIPEKSLMFVNRLSDYFFIVSRYINHLESKQETIWTAL
jgi:cob(I)alamin adenosyltransferase